MCKENSMHVVASMRSGYGKPDGYLRKILEEF